jgi:hypothetical protein
VLASVAVAGVGSVAGCFGIDRSPPSGGLQIDNDTDSAHTVTVSVTEVSATVDIDQREDTTPRQTETRSQSESSFDVAAGESIVQEAFITDAGQYFLRTELETGASDTLWKGFGEASSGITGGYLLVIVESATNVALAYGGQ